MKIQEAAAVSGLSPDTIRFYERKGVLPRPPRQANRYRQYTDEHIAILRLASGLRKLGVPLVEVPPILDVAHTGVCGDIRGRLVDTLAAVLGDVDAQIEGLLKTRQDVTHLLDGLQSMQPDQVEVPGTEACPCVELIRVR